MTTKTIEVEVDIEWSDVMEYFDDNPHRLQDLYDEHADEFELCMDDIHRYFDDNPKDIEEFIEYHKYYQLFPADNLYDQERVSVLRAAYDKYSLDELIKRLS